MNTHKTHKTTSLGTASAFRKTIAPIIAKYEFRQLSEEEIEELVLNNNNARKWNNIFVAGNFKTSLLYNNFFDGIVFIVGLEEKTLKHNGLSYPASITNSTISNCFLGKNVSLHGVGRLSNYVIGDECIVANTNEIIATDTATFGYGVEIQAMNEGGNRKFETFPDILPADAYLWCKYQGNNKLQDALRKINHKECLSRPSYGTIGSHCLVRNVNCIENSHFDEFCTIEGATHISNVTVKSSKKEPSLVGFGSIVEDSVVGYSCKVLENSIVQKVVLGSNVTIEHGARVINTMVGDNSTIACCEVQNSMLFPSHQQHHNNSFLIASTILGQSNIAAGATIGSNHNSRTANGEIVAGRGFWPGLCSSFKHTSRFASFVLVAKGDYQHELNIPLPFSLVNNNLHTDELEVMPAFWWLYNMYALERNNYKFQHRDKRVVKRQNIETQIFAPDTVEEIIVARALLEKWVGQAATEGLETRISIPKLVETGRQFLLSKPKKVAKLEIFAEGMENSSRKVRILKAKQAYDAYGDMLLNYAVSTILQCHKSHSWKSVSQLQQSGRINEWVNLGGQLIARPDFDTLCNDIVSGKLDSWKKIHQRYQKFWEEYPQQKCRHAFAVLALLNGEKEITKQDWDGFLKKFLEIQEYISSQTLHTSSKDYKNPFYCSTYDTHEEKEANLCLPFNDDIVLAAIARFQDYSKKIGK